MTFLKNPGLFPGQTLAEFEGEYIRFDDLEYFGNLVFQTILPKMAAVHRVHLFPAGSNPPNHVNGLKIAVDFEKNPAEIAADILSKIGSFACRSFQMANEFAEIYSKEKEFCEAIYTASRLAGDAFIKSRYNGLSKYLSIYKGMKYSSYESAQTLAEEKKGKKFTPEEFLNLLALVAQSDSFPNVDSQAGKGIEKKKRDFWSTIYNIGRGYSYFNSETVDFLHEKFVDIVEFPESGEDGDGEKSDEQKDGNSGKGKSPDKPDGEKGEGNSDSEDSGKDDSDGDGEDSDSDDSGDGDEDSDGDGYDSDQQDDSDPKEQTGGGISFSNGDEKEESASGAGIPSGNMYWQKIDANPLPPEDEAVKLAALLRPRFQMRKAKLEVIGAGYVDRRKMAEFQFPYQQTVIAEGNKTALAAMICMDGSGSMQTSINGYNYDGKGKLITRFTKSIIAAQAIALAMKNGDPDADVRYMIFDDKVSYSENNNTNLLFAKYFPNGNTSFQFLPEISANFKGEIIVITDGEGSIPDISQFSDTTAKNRIHFIRIGDDFRPEWRGYLSKIAKSVVYCADLSELPALIATSIRPANV